MHASRHGPGWKPIPGAIQRRCGERTQDIFLTSLEGFGGISTVTGRDLLEVSMNSLERACATDTEWTLMVDADVCLFPGALEVVQAAAQDVGPETYQIKFPLKDYILGEEICGVHLHRRTYVTRALSWFRSHAVPGLKSESKNLKAFLREEGLETAASPVVVGVHDAGQYLGDLFVKYVIIGLRKRRALEALVERLTPRRAEPDVAAALAGLEHSRELSRSIPVSRDVCRGRDMIAALGLQEKAPMTPAEGRVLIDRIRKGMRI